MVSATLHLTTFSILPKLAKHHSPGNGEGPYPVFPRITEHVQTSRSSRVKDSWENTLLTDLIIYLVVSVFPEPLSPKNIEENKSICHNQTVLSSLVLVQSRFWRLS